MAVPKHFRGYQCELVNSVPDHLYCKKCTLVARRQTITTCCGESFCHACIADLYISLAQYVERMTTIQLNKSRIKDKLIPYKSTAA